MSDDMSGNAPDTGTAPTASAVVTPPAPPVPPAPPGTGDAWQPRGGGERGIRTGGAAFGAVLILIGLFALFGGLTSVVDLLRLWPLLIVFGGIMNMFHPRDEALVKRIAEGLGSIAVGLVLLANSFGYIPWTVWVTILSLWPVLLVALGIELVGRGLHMNWLRAFSNVVLILALAYGVFVMHPTSGRVVFPFVTSSTATTTFSESKPHDAGVTTGSAAIKVGATRLNLEAGNALASISGKAPDDQAPQLSATVAGSSAAVSVSETSGRTVFIGTEDRNLDVTLDRAVKWSEVRFDLGAIAGDADLSGLDVSRVTMNVGASDVRVKLGSLAKEVKVDISGGATSITIAVPASAACTIDSTSGLSNVSVPPSFRRTSGIVVFGNSSFVSEGTGGPKIGISLASGVSDLRIETY